MNILPLSPLPRETSEESNEFRRVGCEGFIDEQAVSRVISQGAYKRTVLQPGGMSLAASGDDYAGWMLPVKSPFRQMAERHAGAPATMRLPGSPALRRNEEPGIGAQYRGGHRWWLFGVSGAMTCGFMALTLLGLAQRHDPDGLALAPFPRVEKPQVPSILETIVDSPPSLTKVIPPDP